MQFNSNKEDNIYSVLKTIILVLGSLAILYFSTDFDWFNITSGDTSITLVTTDDNTENLDTTNNSEELSVTDSVSISDSLPSNYETTTISFDPEDIVYSEYAITYFAKVDATRFRESPDTDSKVKKSLEANQEVKLIAFTAQDDRQPIESFGERIFIENPWYLVSTRDGEKGWVFGYFLVSTPSNENDFEKLEAKNYFTRTNRTKLRDAPTTNDSRIIRYLNLNTSVVVLGRTKSLDNQIIRSSTGKALKSNMNWYKVRVPSLNKEGWVFGYFLNENKLLPQNGNNNIPEITDSELSSNSNYEITQNEDPALTEEDFDSENMVFDENPQAINKLDYQVGKRLSSRDIVFIPDMDYVQSIEGRIVVNICINKYGEIVKARMQKKGSNSNDPHLKRYSIYLAEQFVFSPSNVNRDCGEIAFSFRY